MAEPEKPVRQEGQEVWKPVFRKQFLKNKAQRPYLALVLTGNESALFSECLKRRPWWKFVVPGDDPTMWNLWWGGNGQICPFKRFKQIDPPMRRMVNRVPGNKEVCTKSRLASRMAKYEGLLGERCPFIPETHMLSARLQIQKEQAKMEKAAERAAAAGRGSIWIVKPDARNRGIGITVHNGIEAVFNHINAQCMGSTWVVQKYIENPLLLGGRKFDIRAYVLITPDRQAYMYNESYVRTSSTLFTLDDLADRSIHLTNDAVQKKFTHYNQFEDHNKMDLAELQQALDAQQLGISVEADLQPQMKEAARQVFSAVIPSLNQGNLAYCFELMGLDFMVDDRKQVYLIEVNTCPALCRHGRVLQDLLPRVMEEVVQRAVDPFFPPESADALPAALNGFELLDVRPFLRPSLITRSQTMEKAPPAAVADRASDGARRTISDFRSPQQQLLRCSSDAPGVPGALKRVPLVPQGVFRC